jgi:hypothetical protein
MSVSIDDLLETMVPDEHSPYARLCLYGPEGSTKTVSACSVGEPDRETILLESDPEGYVSLYNHPDIYYMPDGKTKRIRRFRYEGLSQIDAFVEFISDPRFDAADTIVIDTASGIVNSDLDIITERRFKGQKIDEEVPDWPAYRLNQDRVRRAFTPLMQVEKHIVLTSHDRAEKDKTNLVKTTLDMPQAVRKHLTRMCHLVGYLTAEMQETEDEVTYFRKMQVHPTKLITAKSRIGGLPVVIDEPDLRQIVRDWVASGAKLLDGEEDLAPESESVQPLTIGEPSGLEI